MAKKSIHSKSMLAYLKKQRSHRIDVGDYPIHSGSGRASPRKK